MKGKIVGAAWVPGLPFILNSEKSAQWKGLATGLEALSTHIKELKPEVLVFYSTQWLSVLGTSFQVQPNPKGTHVDENWYEWGDLEFNFKTDPKLGETFASSVAKLGMPTKTVNFEEFPIDTGTLVALKTLNSKNEYPVSIVSSWVYADAQKTESIGKAMAEAVEASGKKAFFIASSLLTTRFFTEEIAPGDDKISHAEDDIWNKKVLSIFESGNLAQGKAVATEFARSRPVDMQFNAFHWLSGVMQHQKWTGQVLAYGPQWGAGAAVAEFRPV